MSNKGKKVPQEFQIELTEQQKQERLDRAATLDMEQEAEEEVLAKESDTWKLRKGELKKKINDLGTERRRLNEEATSGVATITDDTEAVTNFEACQMEYYYPFGAKREEQKLVKTRTLEPDERQANLIEVQAGEVNEGGQTVEDDEE